MSRWSEWVLAEPSRVEYCERTLAWLQEPSPEERVARERALASAAEKHALAVLQRPAAGALLVELQALSAEPVEGLHKQSAGPVEGPHKLSEVLKQLAPIVMEYGGAAFDGDEQAVALALSNAAADALDMCYKNVTVTLDAGALLQALSCHNMLENVPNVMSTCKSALMVHILDVRVHELFRRVMLGYGYGCLDDAHVVNVERELAKARSLMQEAGPVTSKEVLQCVTSLCTNANFVLMCYGEQQEHKKLVAEFATYCVAGSVRAEHGAAFYGTQAVGRQACELLFKVAAGCMQLDSEYLIEEDRQFLCSMDLTRLLFDFANSCSDDVPHITWLLVRLGRDAQFRLFSGPGVPLRKRSRGEGGSA